MNESVSEAGNGEAKTGPQPEYIHSQFKGKLLSQLENGEVGTNSIRFSTEQPLEANLVEALHKATHKVTVENRYDLLLAGSEAGAISGDLLNSPNLKSIISVSSDIGDNSLVPDYLIFRPSDLDDDSVTPSMLTFSFKHSFIEPLGLEEGQANDTVILEIRSGQPRLVSIDDAPMLQQALDAVQTNSEQ